MRISPGESSTEELRSQPAFSAKTLRAAGLLTVASVGPVVTARCGVVPTASPARTSPPWPPPKFRAAAPLGVFNLALSQQRSCSRKHPTRELWDEDGSGQVVMQRKKGWSEPALRSGAGGRRCLAYGLGRSAQPRPPWPGLSQFGSRTHGLRRGRRSAWLRSFHWDRNCQESSAAALHPAIDLRRGFHY